MEYNTLTDSNDAFFHALPLNVIHIRHHGNTRPHAHAFSEMVLILRGSGVHITPEGDMPIGPGDVFVIHPGAAHGYHGVSGLELVNILFNYDELAMSLRDIEDLQGFSLLVSGAGVEREGRFESRLRLSAEQLARTEERIHAMLVEQRTRPAGWRFAMVAQFMLIVAEFCRAFSERDNPSMRSLMRLSSVIGYIHRNYAENLSLDDLANVASMSRRTLTREFRNALGISPIDYLIRERINRAMDLLRSGDMTVTQAAYLVGFQDSNYFTRQFRAIVGCSPRDARRMSVL